ncbi:MAG: hypothetical protein LQ345_005026 [Seirophora villosa]|nr:MAG: hypothetical protein LQ345_005026 [Seirophora villosa]
MASVKPDSIQGQMLQAREMEKQEADELAIRTLGLAQHEALRMRKVPCLDRQNNLILLGKLLWNIAFRASISG